MIGLPNYKGFKENRSSDNDARSVSCSYNYSAGIVYHKTIKTDNCYVFGGTTGCTNVIHSFYTVLCLIVYL